MIKLLETTPDHAFGLLPGVMIYVWRGPTSVASARMIAEGCRRARDMAKDLPVILLGVVEPGTPAPETDARKALSESLKSGRDFIRASALTFEGEGFQASIVRAVATGLSLLARVPYPHQVFPTVDLATDWIGQTVPQHRAADLREALAELRRS